MILDWLKNLYYSPHQEYCFHHWHNLGPLPEESYPCGEPKKALAKWKCCICSAESIS